MIPLAQTTAPAGAVGQSLQSGLPVSGQPVTQKLGAKCKFFEIDLRFELLNVRTQKSCTSPESTGAASLVLIVTFLLEVTIFRFESGP